MATTAYVAFMATLTNRKFTATQYALLSSLMGIPRVIVNTPTGYLAEWLGWEGFFLFCMVATVPGLWLLTRFRAWMEPGGKRWLRNRRRRCREPAGLNMAVAVLELADGRRISYRVAVSPRGKPFDSG